MEESVHQSIRFGSVADLIMRKNRRGGYLLLGSTTLLWFLFQKCGYSFFPFVVNTQLLLVVILFLWAKSAILFNRPMPQLPNLEISEAFVFMVADGLRVWINNTVLAVAREIYVGRNAKQLFRVSVVLWTVSFVGSFLNFLTILYLGVVLSLLIPIVYERYQDHIDDKLSLTHRIIQTQYRKIDERLLQKITAKPSNKIKKMQ
ncbi:PREDICTED: reticulon-like protein B10 [Camelina sativa]|uniref:Reticulon-like protein n=1 Tax=Camelina sativa TaxID=90675 RepID=A0ABM0XPH3_CAMSA|nr:PREDICTED: reticulon-like protein B10 [Camelina sativa]XP_019097111.1 PREDICTED: reticulon-like protein B10 [Camelina sativa]